MTFPFFAGARSSGRRTGSREATDYGRYVCSIQRSAIDKRAHADRRFRRPHEVNKFKAQSAQYQVFSGFFDRKTRLSWNFLFDLENDTIVHPSRLLATLCETIFIRSTPNGLRSAPAPPKLPDIPPLVQHFSLPSPLKTGAALYSAYP
jgi:hypothetical protein